MRPAPVRLEHYHLTSLSIVPIDGYQVDFDSGLYPKFADANLNIQVELGEPDADSECQDFAVHLNLDAKPKDGGVFPYVFSIGADAIISYHGNEENHEIIRELAVVNGASMLYSSLREVLFSLTFRFPNGPMMLPSASFLELRQAIKSGNKITESAPSAQLAEKPKPKNKQQKEKS